MTKQRANQILAAVAHAFADAPRRDGASTFAATLAALAFDRDAAVDAGASRRTAAVVRKTTARLRDANADEIDLDAAFRATVERSGPVDVAVAVAVAVNDHDHVHDGSDQPATIPPPCAYS